MFEEKKLLQASRAGDRDAFEKIVERYQSAICAITFSGTGRLEASEELAQETFVNAWVHLQQLRDLGGFRSWLYGIARNAVRNYHRQKKPVSLETDLDELTSEETRNPPETLVHQEEQMMLERAIVRLPIKYREPLVLFHRQQHSIRETAEVLGLSEATVRTRLHRARGLLREQMAERLEQVLEGTGPRKDFTRAVMVAVGGVPLGMAATAEATVAAGLRHATAANTIATVISSVGAKAVAVALVIVAGTLVYSHWDREKVPVPRPAEVQAEAEASSTALMARQAEAGTRSVEAESPPQTGGDEEPGAEQAVTDVPDRANESTRPAQETIVTGTLLDRNTLAPIAGAHVGLESSLPVITDARGRFRLSLVELREEAWICATASGYASQRAALRVKAGARQEISLRLQPGLTLAGVVVDLNGQPIANAAVQALSNVFAYPATTTDRRGEFEIDGLNPEEVEVHVVAKHVDFLPESAAVLQSGRLDEPTCTKLVLIPKALDTSLSNQTVDSRPQSTASETTAPEHPYGATAATDPSKIYGRVVDAETGEPLDCFRIVRGIFTGAGALMTDFAYIFTCTTGDFDTGWWPLNPGEPVPLTACADGYDPLTLEVLPSSSGPHESGWVVFPLQRNEGRSTIYEGRIVDELGQPITGAEVGFRVEGYLAGRGFSRVMTDAQGRYTISSIDPYEQIAFVRAHGYAPRYYHMSDLLLNATGLFADLVLDPAATVSGFAWDEGGQPIIDTRMIWSPVVRSEEQASLAARFSGLLWPGTRTDEMGYYQLDDVSVGDVQIGVLFDDNRRMPSKTVTLQPGDAVELNFGDQGGLVVSGVVADGGALLERVEVQLKPLDDDAKSLFGRTDAAGHFKIIEVPAGRYVFATLLPLEPGAPARDPDDASHVLYEVMDINSDLDLMVDYQTRTIENSHAVP